MIRLKVATRFKRDLKKYKHEKLVLDNLEDIIKLLVNEKKLPEKNRNHDLVGDYISHRKCHITPDTLLIYKKDNEQLSLERIGSHSELF